jgi:hypothetical protein
VSDKPGLSDTIRNIEKQRIQAEIVSISAAMLKNIHDSVDFNLQTSFEFRGQYSENILNLNMPFIPDFSEFL